MLKVWRTNETTNSDRVRGESLVMGGIWRTMNRNSDLNKFYIVMIDGPTTEITYRHKTALSALKEAERLATKTGRKFFVAQTIFEVVPQKTDFFVGDIYDAIPGDVFDMSDKEFFGEPPSEIEEDLPEELKKDIHDLMLKNGFWFDSERKVYTKCQN